MVHSAKHPCTTIYLVYCAFRKFPANTASVPMDCAQHRNSGDGHVPKWDIGDPKAKTFYDTYLDLCTFVGLPARVPTWD